MQPTRTAGSFAFALALAAALGGCGGGEVVPPDTGPADAGMDTGEGCVAGELECECDAGACVEGVCLAGVCTDCRVASDGCVCRSNGTCETGLRCDDATMVCEPCPTGEEGCACGEEMACASGLECSSGLCVPDTCVEGTIDCPCRAGAPSCDEGSICDGAGLCRACTTDMPGCPCDAGACTGGLVCESTSTTCRPAITCADLRAALSCGEFQRCDEAAGVDATCVDGECALGYRWRASDSTCVACVSPECSAEPTCAPGMPGSLDCAVDHRVCTETDGLGACGACETGFTEIAGVCVQLGVCGSDLCDPDEYCDTTAPAGPTCTPWPCPTLTEVRDSGGTCVSCTRSCAVSGSTGRFWPYTDEGDVCVCETAPGYYFDNGGEAAPVACDEDGDGWVRQEVRAILDRRPPDPAIVANARCDVRSAGVVELRDEYGNPSRIESCDEGLLQDRTGGTCEPLPLRLFESKRNDVAGEAARLGEAPAYATGGRRFRPEELNGLTKACVTPLGDYDDDGFEDVTQAQPMPPDSSALGETARLRSFAHFVELYTTSWIPPAGAASLGTLVIQERSRCADGFAITYGSDAPYDPALPQSYWRNCERRRDPDFDADAPTAGYDFAQWACDNRAGSCSAAPAPAHDTEAAMPTSGLLRDHGLCELAGARPAGGVFRGMNHHSQFQCVTVIADGTTPAPHQRTRSSFGGTSLTTTGPASATAPAATLTFNACQVPECGAGGTCPDTSVPTTNGGVDAHDPVIECSVPALGALPAAGAVGWAAVRYQTYGERDSSGGPLHDQLYNGGCVNEQAEWPALCPPLRDPSRDPPTGFGYCNPGLLDAFGRYCCYGCGDGCPYANAGGNCLPTAADPTVTECRLGTCDAGWDNCDGREDTGCENSLDSLATCGMCGVSCSRDFAGETCAGDVCRFTTCEAGYDDCDGLDGNGCENALDSLTHCGTCNTVCSLAHATESCAVAGFSDQCRITACDTSWYDANSTHSDGCECQDAATNNSCGSSATMGAIAVGGGSTLLSSGLIPIDSTVSYDWYRIDFPIPVGGTPTIDFETNTGSQFRFDVFVGGCAATNASVCTGSGPSEGSGEVYSGLTSWHFVDNASAGYTSRSISWPSTVYVRVHRAAAGKSCDTYTLRATRP